MHSNPCLNRVEMQEVDCILKKDWEKNHDHNLPEEYTWDNLKIKYLDLFGITTK